MKLEIKEDRKNPFMKRSELVVDIEHEKESTPSKAALQQLLAKQLGKAVEHVDIRNIFSSGGLAKSCSKVFVWEEKLAKDLSKVPKEETKEEVKEEGRGPKAEKVPPKEEEKIKETGSK